MKRFPIALLALIVCWITVSALGETTAMPQEVEQPLYEAVTNISFHIRKTPEDNSRRIKEVGSHKTLLVYAYDEQWCKVLYDNALGYCKTKWLHRYRSLQPEKAFVPRYPTQEGFAQVIAPTHVSVKGYGGNDLLSGNLISVHRWNRQEAVIHMMRSTTTVVAEDCVLPLMCLGKMPKKGTPLAGSQPTTVKKQAASSEPSGKTFSYNALCAPYNKANGYKIAPNISDDGQGYGGGVCQLSTTIYNAVLGLSLQIEEWTIHRDSGVPYIPKSFDAAVGSYSDLIINNTLPYDVRLETMPQNGALTVLVYRN